MSELLASENRLRVLLGCTKGIVFEFDREGRYVGVWTHDEELLAKPADQLIGRTIVEALGETEGQRFTQTVQRVFDTGTAETIWYDLDVQGGRKWFAADVVVAPEVSGRERTVVYLVRDVTAFKQLEEQLRQSQKMEAIGRLAGGIAHDFNNILTTIIGYSEMLLSDLDERTPRHQQAQRIRHAAGRAAALTKQLLAYGRRQVLMPEDLDVNAVIVSMADMLRRLIGENVELRLELDPALGGAKVDRSGLEQVIMNLSINARDAIEGSGRVVIRTDTVEIDEEAGRLRELASGRYVRIITSDSGHGIDDATRARIFEPFFTTKELGKGTGLGLSTAYGIVKQSAGHIEVESAPGRGSSFTVYLPHTTNTTTTTVALPVERTRTPPDAPTVLVAEDDEDVRQLIDRHLRRAGYDVVLAGTGADALDKASDRRIDLLVTDMVMPKLGGEALARQLRETNPTLGILYISGYPEALEVPRLTHSSFLRKPFTRQALITQVETLLDPGDRGPESGMLDEAE